jgi:hypothetical protein
MVSSKLVMPVGMLEKVLVSVPRQVINTFTNTFLGRNSGQISVYWFPSLAATDILAIGPGASAGI